MLKYMKERARNMNDWNPYFNDHYLYDEGYDVDEWGRDENHSPVFPAMPAAQTMPATYTHSSCGCQSTPMWHGATPWMGGAYPMTDMGSPNMGVIMSPGKAPMSSMPMMPGAPATGTVFPMPGTTAQMPMGQMSYPYGPSYYEMPPFPYGYYPHR